MPTKKTAKKTAKKQPTAAQIEEAILEALRTPRDANTVTTNGWILDQVRAKHSGVSDAAFIAVVNDMSQSGILSQTPVAATSSGTTSSAKTTGPASPKPPTKTARANKAKPKLPAITSIEQLNSQEAWWECKRGDVMLDYLATSNVSPKALVRAACDIADPAFGELPEHEHRPKDALKVVRAWARGDATLAEVERAEASAQAVVDETSNLLDALQHFSRTYDTTNALKGKAWEVEHALYAAISAARNCASAAGLAKRTDVEEIVRQIRFMACGLGTSKRCNADYWLAHYITSNVVWDDVAPKRHLHVVKPPTTTKAN